MLNCKIDQKLTYQFWLLEWRSACPRLSNCITLSQRSRRINSPHDLSQVQFYGLDSTSNGIIPISSFSQELASLEAAFYEQLMATPDKR